jgi:hypothetical protein
MASRTLIGGTAYTISGGRTLVNGTGYNIKEGKTLVDGTSYKIDFTPEIYAVLYNTGDLKFQKWNTSFENGKTVIGSYANVLNNGYSSWWPKANVKNVSFTTPTKTTTLARWFREATNLVNFNATNLDLNSILDASGTFYNCSNYTG